MIFPSCLKSVQCSQNPQNPYSYCSRAMFQLPCLPGTASTGAFSDAIRDDV
jgi:hypothetical protein